jgi:hypothetical protein
MLPCFSDYLCFTLGFMHLQTIYWLEVLITCSISVEIVSMIRQVSVVAGLWCYFLSLDWGGMSQ